MSRSVRDLLVRGIAAAKAGEKNEARFYLEKALMIDASTTQRQEAWLWLSEISDDPAIKRRYLEAILSVNPAHPEARRNIAVLDGRLRAEEIIDPNRLSTSAPESPQPAQARRFICPQCGGRMVFTPDGATLACEYCSQRRTPSPAPKESTVVDEQDFVVALATAKGHTRPVATHSLVCQGCGSSFVLPPEVLSSSCPYCASAYVIDKTEVLELIPPEGLIPFSVTREGAHRAALQWLSAEGLESYALEGPPTGVYFPVWTFDIGGKVTWRGLKRKAGMRVQDSGSRRVNQDDVPVPASRALPTSLADVVSEFRLAEVVPYDPAYLADWPAETYSISVSDASLVARQRVLEQVQERFTRGSSGPAKDGKLSSMGLILESYKLVLLPLWIAHYRDRGNSDKSQDEKLTIVVNGQTGTVCGEKPAQGLRRMWSWLMGDEKQ